MGDPWGVGWNGQAFGLLSQGMGFEPSHGHIHDKSHSFLPSKDCRVWQRALVSNSSSQSEARRFLDIQKKINKEKRKGTGIEFGFVKMFGVEVFPFPKPSHICLNCLMFIHLQFPLFISTNVRSRGCIVSWDLHFRSNPRERE